MDPSLELIPEVVADLPLLVGLLQHLHFAEMLEQTLGTHRNTARYNTLPNGLALLVWLTFLLSEGDHCKMHVADWVTAHQVVLARLLQVPAVPATDFSDDRLSTLLTRLAVPAAWEATEAAVLGRQLEIYAVSDVGPIRLDSTTEYGFHTPQPGGVMQLGHSKDHRPDLAQLKLMAATLGTGQLLSCVVEPGQRADDPLYTPMIDRARRLLKRRGLLYVGDCKMASLETRAHVVHGGDWYLTTLPKRTRDAEAITAWQEQLVSGTLPGEWITQTCATSAVQCLLGRGGEVRRTLTAKGAGGKAGRTVTWEERVVLFQSTVQATQQRTRLWEAVQTLAATLRALTPPPHKGVKQYRNREALQTVVDALLTKGDMAALLTVTLEMVPWRAGQNRAVVSAVTINTAQVEARCARFGWRAYVTNAPAAQLSPSQIVTEYRGAWAIERDFHQLKDRPLGIHPLWVRTDQQITGLMHLVTLAARVLFYLEQRVREGLRRERRGLSGLHQYRDKTPITAPTATKLLTTLAEKPMLLTYFNLDGHTGWHLSPCPPWVEDVIRLLELPADTYLRLLNSS